jgi:hypothetical protein
MGTTLTSRRIILPPAVQVIAPDTGVHAALAGSAILAPGPPCGEQLGQLARQQRDLPARSGAEGGTRR